MRSSSVGVLARAALASADRPLALALGLGLIEAIEQPLLACDASGRLILANAAARSLFLLSDQLETAAVDLSAVRLAHESGWELAGEQHPLVRSLAGEQLLAERVRLLSGADAARLIELSTRPLHDGYGGLLGAMMTICAVDDESAREERLLGFASDLEMLSEVSRTLSELSDPDQAAEIICTVTLGATGAVAVLLWELTGRELQVRRCEGALPAEALGELVERARAGARRSVLDASTVVERVAPVAQDECSPKPLRAADQDYQIGSAWHEPMTSGGQLTGVLSILWVGCLRDLERPGRLIGPLAHHAATALERSRLLRLLQQAARTDPLTGVANRRVWQDTLGHELKRAGRECQPLSLVLIDIDGFKLYNDRFGHPGGDRLLQDAARAWSRQLRSSDMLARVGGEEFAVILPSCPPLDARVVAERLRAAMPGGETCSLGVVTCDGLASARAMYEAADRALYVAKHRGRNRVEVGRCAGADRNYSLHAP